MLIGFSEAQAKPIDAPDSRLMDYTRVTLSLSLCVATFEQEHKDVRNARRYQEGIVRVDQLMRQGGWDQEEWSRAYEIVLQEDYSFSLSPEATWGSFQREYFTSEFCDDVLEQFNGEKE